MGFRTLVSITTFKKSEALAALLASLVKHGYNQYPTIISCDWSNKKDRFDNTPQQVLEKYKGTAFLAGLFLAFNEKTSQVGIAGNKNRAVEFFLKNKEQFDSLTLLDDDLLMMKEGLIDHLFMTAEASNLGHLTGYWTDFDQNRLESSKLVGLSGNNWFKDFPVKAANEYVTWNNGCQGCMVWIKKDLVEKASYFNKMPYFYGMEHSLYSARLNRIEGLPPEQFAVLKRSEKHTMGQNIPNDYDISHEKLNTLQTKAYRELLDQVYKGYGLKVEETSLPRKGEKFMQINPLKT